MVKSYSIRDITHGFFFRPRKSIILALVLILIFTYVTRSIGLMLVREPQPVEEPPKKEFSLLNKRKKFSNKVYDKIESTGGFKSSSLDSKCESYFEVLSEFYPGNPGEDIVDIETLVNDEFNNFVYNKRKWIRDRRKKYRLEHRGQRVRMTADLLAKFADEHEGYLKLASDHEEIIYNDFSHMRVFGKCFVNDDKRDGKSAEQCSLFETKLYPWMAKRFAKFEDWKGIKLKDGALPTSNGGSISQDTDNKCFVKEIIAKSSGKGIVIPVMPTYPRERQIRNLKRLIQVLRGLKNHLPIQITHTKHTLSQSEKEELRKAARTDIAYLPGSFGDYYRLIQNEEPSRNFVSSSDYPKQDIWFVDLENTKDENRHPLVANSPYFNSPDFIFTLSTIFNSFKEAIVLTEHAVPLHENFFDTLFNNDGYRKNGILLFKNPSLTSNRPRIFVSGFHEISDLIKSYLMPSSKDKSYFKIHPRNKKLSPSTRIFEDSFQKLIDSSVMVFDKSKVLNGMLIAANMHMYKAFSARFPSAKDALNPEFLWLGQEIAGTNPKVNFNRHYGVAAGVLTPPELKPTEKITYSQEMCSSSWGQLSDVDDDSLLFVTSHQMENWMEVDKFRTDLEGKYTIVHKESSDSNREDSSPEETDDKTFFENTLKKNPQYIEAVINPPVLQKPIFEDSRESSRAWVEFGDFADYRGHPLLCAYDIVGSHTTNKRGRIIYYNDKRKAWFRYVLDLWFEEL